MAEDQKAVTRSFSVRLALFISIIALILSIVAYNRSSSQEQIQTDIKNLETKPHER